MNKKKERPGFYMLPVDLKNLLEKVKQSFGYNSLNTAAKNAMLVGGEICLNDPEQFRQILTKTLQKQL